MLYLYVIMVVVWLKYGMNAVFSSIYQRIQATTAGSIRKKSKTESKREISPIRLQAAKNATKKPNLDVRERARCLAMQYFRVQ